MVPLVVPQVPLAAPVVPSLGPVSKEEVAADPGGLSWRVRGVPAALTLGSSRLAGRRCSAGGSSIWWLPQLSRIWQQVTTLEQ